MKITKDTSDRTLARARAGIGLAGTPPLDTAAFHKSVNDEIRSWKEPMSEANRLMARGIEKHEARIKREREGIADELINRRTLGAASGRLHLTAVRALEHIMSTNILTAFEFKMAKRLNLPVDEIGVPILTKNQTKRLSDFEQALVLRKVTQQARKELKRGQWSNRDAVAPVIAEVMDTWVSPCLMDMPF